MVLNEELSNQMSVEKRPELRVDPRSDLVLAANEAACQFYQQSELTLIQTPLHTLLSSTFAQLDPLTQLPNRQLFLDRLQQSLTELQRSPSGLAVLFIDLDRFKPINDSLGHQAGDAVLIEVAKRLQSLLRKQDTLARIGGDEFVVLLKEVTAIQAVERIAQTFLNALAMPFEIPQGVVEIGGSIGVAMGPQDAQTAEALLQKADLAMYRAKHNGRQQWMFFSQALGQEAQRKFHMEQSLREALETDELKLQFEPIINATETKLFALEVQVSQQSLDLLGQDWESLLPVLSQSILGVQFSEWQLQAALDVQQSMSHSSLNVPMAVSVPGIHFRQKNFVDFIESALHESEVDPQLLILQLDESSLNHSSIDVAQRINALNEIGVQVVLEQFGLQGVSLLQLARLPFAAIKVGDLGLRNLSHGRRVPMHENTQLAAAILAFAYQLNKTLIATQIYSNDQWHFMQSQHCQWGQGPYLGEAMNAEALVDYLVDLNAQRLELVDKDDLDPLYENFDD